MAVTLKELIKEYYLLNKLPSNETLERLIMSSSVDMIRLLHAKTIGQNINIPPVQCRVKWVKAIIKQVENRKEYLSKNEPAYFTEEEEEVECLWYDSLEDLARNKTQIEPYYRLYVDPVEYGNSALKIYENEAFVSDGTTGLVTWEASTELVKYFQENPKVLNSFSWVVEIGCGCGYLALCVLRMNSNLKKYIATDGSPIALKRCEENFAANTINQNDIPNVIVKKLDWTNLTDAHEFSELVEECANVYGSGLLIGADIVFDPELIPSLLEIVKMFLSIPRKTEMRECQALLSCTVRNEDTFQCLKTQLEFNELQYEDNRSNSWENGTILRIHK